MRTSSGQALLEAVIVMPLFLAIAFALLQVGHIGVAMALVNYGASSAARQAVEFNDPSDTNASARFSKVVGGSLGLQPSSVRCQLDTDPVTPNLTVTACATLTAYPFVGEILDSGLKAQSSTFNCADAVGAKSLGPIAIKGPAPYKFVIQGQAVARMNYASH